MKRICMKRAWIGFICLCMVIGLKKAEPVLAKQSVPTTKASESVELILLTKEYAITRDALYQNSEEILIQVLKNGETLSESEMMRMEFKFLWQGAGQFQMLEVEYGKDGTIAVTPQFMIADGILGKVLKWLTLFIVPDGNQKMIISYNDPSGIIKSETYDFTIDREEKKVSLIWGMLPIVFLVITYGYVCKKRFLQHTTLEFMYHNKKEQEGIWLCSPPVEEKLAVSRWVPSGVYSFIPFLSNRKKIGDLMFYAGGLALARNRHLIIKSDSDLEEVRMITKEQESSGASALEKQEKSWKRVKITKNKIRVPYGSQLSIVFKEYPDLVFNIGIH